MQNPGIECGMCCQSAKDLGQMIIAYSDCSDNKLPEHYSSYLHKYNIGGVEPRGCKNSPDLKAFDPPLIIASNGYGRHGDEPSFDYKDEKGKAAAATIDQSKVMTNPFDLTYRESYDFLLDEGCHRLLGFVSCHYARQSGFNTLFGPSVEVDPGWSTEKSRRWLKYDQANINGHRLAGCQNTVKHYPFVNNSYAMHRELMKYNLSPDDVVKAEAGFASAVENEKPTFVMTTHIMDENIDPKAPPTFSPIWIERLKKMSEKNPPGPLIMTDGMFMVSRYPMETYYPTLLGDIDAGKEGILNATDIARFSNECPVENKIDRYWLDRLVFPPSKKSSKKKGVDRPLYEIYSGYNSQKELGENDIMAIALKMGFTDGSIELDAGEIKLIKQFHCLSRMFAADTGLRKRLKATDDKFMGIVTQRAFMAGHDLAIMEGSPQDGAKSMDYMIKTACSAGPVGETFRARIAESSVRIATMKNSPGFKSGLNPPPEEELPKDIAANLAKTIETMNAFLNDPKNESLIAAVQANANCRSLLPSEFSCLSSYPSSIKFLDSKATSAE